MRGVYIKEVDQKKMDQKIKDKFTRVSYQIDQEYNNNFGGISKQPWASITGSSWFGPSKATPLKSGLY